MKLIGLVGQATVGKDAFYNALNGNYIKKRMAFADELKMEVARACGVTVGFVEANKHLFRPMLQWWGTDFKRRMFGDDYWISRLNSKLCEFDPMPEVIVITDVRFLNEANYVTSLGGKLVRIVRPSVTRSDTHPSETEQHRIMVKFEIINDGSLEEFKDKVRKLTEKLQWQKLY
jgi:hypothetical protein